MGPKYGTPEYHEQVDRICKACADVPLGLLPAALMLYALDKTYSRSAVCEAENILKRNFYKKLKELKKTRNVDDPRETD